MKIKGYAAFTKKADLKLFEYEPKKLDDKDVLIEITHCGICHSDLHLIDNDWQSSRYPFIPGHEIIGNVIGKGDKVTALEIGQRVGVGWQSGACFECEACEHGNDNQCIHQEATCVGRNGGFAESIIVDSRFAFAVPENLTSENAAPLLCGGVTVYSPLVHHGVRPADKVGVIGIGGLGHLALQFAAAMGCEVTAFSTSSDKEKEAKSYGAHKFINSKDAKQMESAIRSLDFIISTVFVNLNWEEYIKILKPNGKFCFVGAPPAKLDIFIPPFAMSQKTVTGSAIGPRWMIREMLGFASRHNIQAKTELYPIKDVNKAITRLRENKVRYRAVLKM